VFPTKIVVAVDGSEEARLASRVAANLAQRTDSELHVVHATPMPWKQEVCRCGSLSEPADRPDLHRMGDVIRTREPRARSAVRRS